MLSITTSTREAGEIAVGCRTFSTPARFRHRIDAERLEAVSAEVSTTAARMRRSVSARSRVRLGASTGDRTLGDLHPSGHRRRISHRQVTCQTRSRTPPGAGRVRRGRPFVDHSIHISQDLMRPSGRAPDQLRPIALEPGAANMPRARACSRSATPGAVHRLGRRARAAVPAQYRQGMGHRRIRHVAALDPHPHRARGRQGQTVGPHPGDSAADRAELACDHRPGRARRTPGQDRLRRDPGRWQHPHRRDHRIDRGAGAGLRQR